MRFLGKLWPDVVARRTWDADGRPAWEFRITSHRTERPGHTRAAALALPAAPTPWPALPPSSDPIPHTDGRDQGDTSTHGQSPTQDEALAQGETLTQEESSRSRLTHAGVVTSRGVRIGGDTLRIDEFHYRISRPDIDFDQVLDGPDIAVALLELAADPASEILRDRVAARLAVIRGWFQNAPTLDVTAARITGRGIGRLLDGVFIWRAHDSHDTLTYVVTPSLQARDLLKADPRLASALIQVACPRPEDPQAELERRLTEAIGRLNAAAEPGLEPGGAQSVVGSGAVLEIRSSEVPVSVSAATADRRPGDVAAGDGDGAGGGGSVPASPVKPTPARSDSERALSEELAELARKVGTAAVRAPSRRPAVIDLDASARRTLAEPFLQPRGPGGGTPEGREH